MSNLTSYAQNLYNLALLQGVTNANPQIFKVSISVDCVICCAFAEPVDLLLPMNGLWLCADPVSSRFLKIYQRQSKIADAVNNTQHTWSEVTVFETLFTAQYWAAEDLPQPIIISNSGGKLSGKLVPRTVSTYDADEVIPQSKVDSKIATMRNGFFTMYTNMNNRVLYDDDRIRALQSKTASMQTVIDQLQSSAMLLGGWVQEEASDIWFINHAFGTPNIFIMTWSSDGEPLCYQKIQAFDENITQVSFLESCSGVALVFGLSFPQQRLDS